MFLANLNSTLQALCLHNYGFLVRWRLKKVLDYIEIYSRNLFERKGMKLNLWLLEVWLSLYASHIPRPKTCKDISAVTTTELVEWIMTS